MHGKVCLLTGPTVGVGPTVARGLAEKGAYVVLVIRDPVRGKAHVDAINEAVGEKRAALLVANLGSQADVRRVAERFSAGFARLDVLIHNELALPFVHRLTPEGAEESVAINHLAPFLLTQLLMPEMRAAGSARIITTSAREHARSLMLEKLHEERKDTFSVYAQAKLLNLLFTYELARRFDGTGVTANAVYAPCTVSGGGLRNLVGNLRHRLRRAGYAQDSFEDAAHEVLRLASDPALATVNGKVFADGKEQRSAPITYDKTLARRLWEESERLTHPP